MSQYADDFNFFLKEAKSIETVLIHIEKLQKATWAAILPINKNQTKTVKQKLSNVKIKQHNTIEIVGVTCRVGLKESNELNWNKIIEKWEKT